MYCCGNYEQYQEQVATLTDAWYTNIDALQPRSHQTAQPHQLRSIYIYIYTYASCKFVSDMQL